MKKETRGRKPLTYKTKRLMKVVPEEIFDDCMQTVESKIEKYAIQRSK